jgi:hypothetical protein
MGIEYVNRLTATEASIKEMRRLVKDITGGEPHNFKKDKLAQGYTKP